MNGIIRRNDQEKILEETETSFKCSLKSIVFRPFKSFYKFGFRNDAKLLVRNASVLIIGNVCQIMFIIMSTIFCGHLGLLEQNAVAICSTITILANISPIIGMASACDTLFPRFFGGEDKLLLGLAFQKGSILLALTGAFCSIILGKAQFILKFLSDEPEVIDLASKYLFINIPSPIFYGVYIAASRYLEAQSILKPIIFTGIIANIINASLHAILLFVFQIGVKGSAIANLVANMSQPIILISYIIFSKVYKPTWPGWSKDCLKGWWEFLKLGLPGCLLEVLDWSYFDIAVIAAGRLSPIELTITSIGNQIIWMASMVYLGLSVSGNILSGSYLGQNLPKKALNSVKVLITIGILTSLFQSTVVISLSEKLPYVFSQNQEVLNAARPLMSFMAVSIWVESIQSYGSGILKTAGAQQYAMIFNLICFYLLGMPLGYYFMFKSGLKALGFFFSHSIVGTLLFMMQIMYISHVDWKNKAKEAHQKENENTKDSQIELSHKI